MSTSICSRICKWFPGSKNCCCRESICKVCFKINNCISWRVWGPSTIYFITGNTSPKIPEALTGKICHKRLNDIKSDVLPCDVFEVTHPKGTTTTSFFIQRYVTKLHAIHGVDWGVFVVHPKWMSDNLHNVESRHVQGWKDETMGYKISLTHWGRVTHKCVGKSTIIASDNGLSPGRRQAII